MQQGLPFRLPKSFIDLKPLVSRTYPFEQAIAAFEDAAEGRPDTIKVQIELPA